MSNQLGPIDVTCDAPAYSVVRACRCLGISAPEDVRWCQLSHFLSQPDAATGLFHFLGWENILGRVPGERTCSCGERLPVLERVAFTFSTGREETYMLGQCRRCGTVFWEEG